MGVNATLDLPQNDIFEVTLIGTGGGYGESIVAHLGNQNWIIVDSCVEPKNGNSLPLEYLKNIGVNFKNIKLIVCTHWHNDHILGLSKVLKECTNANFVFSQATDRLKFLQFVRLDYQKLKHEETISSTKEFNECLEIIEARNSVVKSAISDRLLFTEQIDENNICQVFSLSPSDYSMAEFQSEISTLITEYGLSNRKIVAASPNAKSIVLFLKSGVHRAILGGDLEVSIDERKGWKHIINHNQVIDIKSSLFKVSHHASENGYSPEIYEKLLAPNAISKITPWNRNKKLPEVSMLKKYCAHSKSVYITSSFMAPKGKKIKLEEKPKKRTTQINKILEKQKYKLREVKYVSGIVRSRIKLNDNMANWSVSLFGEAFHVNPVL